MQASPAPWRSCGGRISVLPEESRAGAPEKVRGMDFRELLLRVGLRSRVLHRLPGRVRVEIPALRRIPQENRNLVHRLIKAIPQPQGLKSLEPSFITGNVLLEYDRHVTTEAHILEHIDGVVSLIVRYRDKMALVNAENLPRVLARLQELLNNGDTASHTCLKEVVISDDVWS